MVIFVVDDEQIIAGTIAIILRQAGFEVYPFQSALAAREKAKVRTPDLLLTDVAMPEMDGMELARKLTALHPRCNVICFSGHAEWKDLIRHPLYAAPWKFLLKPVHPQALIQEIRNLSSARVEHALGEPVALMDQVSTVDVLY